jgi:DNA modification methylase
VYKNNLKISEVLTGSLTPYARNSRTHSVEQIAAIADSLKEFGWTNPILVDADGGIIAGEGRWRAALLLKMKRVPTIELKGLSEAQRRAYVIADNQLALRAGWNEDLLRLELGELQGLGFSLEKLGFEAAELGELLAGTSGDSDPDEAPEPPADPITRPGDLWVLGNHRLLCGDATSKSDVDVVCFGGEKALLMATDPPYGVAYNNAERPNPGVAKPRVAKPRVANDELVDGPAMQAFSEAMLSAALPHMDKRAAFYFWHPMLTQGTYVAAAAAAAGILIHRQIIWVKAGMLLGRGDYHWRHELCFYGWRKGNRPPFYGPRNQDTVWELTSVGNKERREMNHATPKPVGLWDKPIANHTKFGELIYEPFLGSGTTIIAAEMTGRKCFAMEIDPGYCDVAVARWEKFTGRKAELSDGKKAGRGKDRGKKAVHANARAKGDGRGNGGLRYPA